MENASKALTMAGSILIALLVIGLLVLFFHNLSSEKQTEENVKAESQATDFNKQYESYNSTNLYGSQIISLMNKMMDYNQNDEKVSNYGTISMTVILNDKNNSDATYMKAGTYDLDKLNKAYNNLTNEISNKNKKSYKGQTISYWAASKTELESNFTSTTSPTLDYMKNLIIEYNVLKNESDDFSRKTFKCTGVTYDKANGRITEMIFNEK